MVNKGTHFEIYIEHLFRGCGISAERNLIYIKNKSLFRKRRVAQVDIQVGNKGLISVPLIYELKYSSNRNIGMGENPVDQLLRAVSITGFKPGGIITNRSYTSSLTDYAKSKKIRLYDSSYLLKLEKKRKSIDGYGFFSPSLTGKDLEQRLGMIEQEISRINPKDYQTRARTIYL